MTTRALYLHKRSSGGVVRYVLAFPDILMRFAIDASRIGLCLGKRSSRVQQGWRIQSRLTLQSDLRVAHAPRVCVQGPAQAPSHRRDAAPKLPRAHNNLRPSDADGPCVSSLVFQVRPRRSCMPFCQDVLCEEGRIRLGSTAP